jgi:hypothetical protein
VPAPVRDRHLDEGDQELGRRLLVTRHRLHCGVQEAAADRAVAALAPHARANSPRSKQGRALPIEGRGGEVWGARGRLGAAG